MPWSGSSHLEQLGGDHEAAAGQVGLLVHGHLQQALDKGADAHVADVGLHRLEQQAQEHGRLVGVRHIPRRQHRIQRPAAHHISAQTCGPRDACCRT